MAINYAKKYATKIAEAFVKPSITDDDCGKQYTWNGPNSRTIVVANGGSITASNQKNGGALFRIALPMEKEETHEN